MNILSNSPHWYKEGLHFKCTECGKCCTGFPGVVWVNKNEIKNLSKHFNLSTEQFKKKYLRRIEGKWALQECPKTYDCVFLENNRCSVYDKRPTQCSTFPWWPQNLENSENWENAAKNCEGIHNSAPKVSYQEIQKQLQVHLEGEM